MGEGDTKPVVLKDGSIVEVEQIIPPQASVNAAKELLAIYNGPKTHHHHHTAAPSVISPPTDHGTTSPPDGPLTRAQAAAMTPAERQAYERSRLGDL